MIVAVPVTPDGLVDRRWGKADQVAVARVEDGAVRDWRVHQTDWHRLHDEGHHGSHHARVVRFLRDNQVEAVVIDHAGASMLNTIQKMGLNVVLDAAGSARDAALLAS